MTASRSPDWAAIRRRYEETDDASADIAAAGGITRKDLAARARKEKWRRQKPRPFPPARVTPAGPDRVSPLGPSTPPPTRRVSATPAARRRLFERLVSAISLKLEQLERRMSKDLAGDDLASATDHEREARAIGALIDNLDKITEMQSGLSKSVGKRGPAADGDLAHEADRYRRELAERLSRLVGAAGE